MKRFVIVGDNLVNLMAFPGVIIHESSHVLACRLVGVEVETATWVQFRHDLLSADWEPMGHIDHGRPDAPWKNIAISLAPLVPNALVAVFAFRFAQWILGFNPTLPPAGGLLWQLDSFFLVLEQLFTAVVAASPLGQFMAFGGLWIGFSAGFSAVPSPGDGRSALATSLNADGWWTLPLGGLALVGLFLGSEVTSIYFLAPLFYLMVGVVEVQFALQLLPLFGVLVGGSVGIWTLRITLALLVSMVSRWRTPGISTIPSPLLSFVSEEVRRLNDISDRIDAETALDEAEIEYVVAQLSHPADEIRQKASIVLTEIARTAPATLLEHQSTILSRVDAESSQSCRINLYATLSVIVENAQDPSCFLDVALDGLKSDSEKIRWSSSTIIVKIAIESPDAVSPVVDRLVPKLDDGRQEVQRNLVLTLDCIAEHDPNSLTGFKSQIQSQCTGLDAEVRDVVPTLLEVVDAD